MNKPVHENYPLTSPGLMLIILAMSVLSLLVTRGIEQYIQGVLTLGNIPLLTALKTR